MWKLTAVVAAKEPVVAKELVVAKRASDARKCSVGNGRIAMSESASKLPVGNARISAARDILSPGSSTLDKFDPPSSNKFNPQFICVCELIMYLANRLGDSTHAPLIGVRSF